MKSLSDIINAFPRVLVSLWRRAEHVVFSRFAKSISAVDPHGVVKNCLLEKPEFKEAFQAFNEQDYPQAYDLFKRIAREGDAAAQNNVGVLYETGTGVIRIDHLAEEWYRRAAVQGLAEAQFNLAAILASDLMVGHASHDAGVEESQLIEAYMWVTLAADQNHRGALSGVTRLRRHLSDAQIAEAQRLAREWKPKKEGK